MRVILAFILAVLSLSSAHAENPVNLGAVSASFVLDVQTLIASAALIAMGFSMAMFSFYVGIQALRWLRDAAGDSKSKPASKPIPQQGPSEYH